MNTRPSGRHQETEKESASRPGQTAYARIRPVRLSVASATIVLGMIAPGALAASGAPPTTTTTTPTTTSSTTRVAGPTTSTTPPVPRVAGASPDGADLPYLGDPRLDADLGGVAVDTPAFRRALEAYRGTTKRRAEARATEADAIGRLTELEAAQERLVGQLNQATRRKEKSDARLAKLRGTLEHLAVDDYMRGESATGADLDLDLDSSTDFRRQRVVLKTVRATQLADARENTDVVLRMTDIILASQAELDDVRARIATTTATRDRAVTDQRLAEAQLLVDVKTLADARMTGDVAGLDFPIVVLDAYYKAAKRMKADSPSCRIRWTLVAAISRTEGRHGTYAGGTVDADGNTTEPILGIALDGSNNTATVADSDGGALDGDPTTDRAVGPMQFIPSTWQRWGRDGNGDGKVDPHNMYDASLAAAAYLCHYGPGLDTDAGIRGAVIHYNVSEDYVELVLSRAKGYDVVTLPAAPKLSS